MDTTFYCDRCEGKTEAKNYCNECEKYLCDKCTTSHKESTATEQHQLIEAAAKATEQKIKSEVVQEERQIVEMDAAYSCDRCEGKTEAKNYCNECEEYLCDKCTTSHKESTATEQHQLIEAAAKATEQKIKSEVVQEERIAEMDTAYSCDPCDGKTEAKNYCDECEEFLCDECTTAHKKRKATKQHIIIAAEEKNKDQQMKSQVKQEEKIAEMNTAYSCDPCEGKTEAKNYCDECEEYLCDECTTAHKKRKATKQHMIVAAEYAESQQMKSKVKQEETIAPGRPKASEILSDSMTLVWDPPTKFEDKDCYQINLKDMGGERKWRAYQGEYYTPSANLSNLKSNARYIFRVRVIHEDGEEGPYSPESEEIHTSESLATRMLQKSTQVTDGDISPVKYAMPLTAVIPARNTRAKTRKFEIGTRPRGLGYKETKTIMLVGATGTGKSTFVDGLINYVLGVTWDDPFRYTIIDLEDEEKNRIENQAFSQTEWITCYTIYPEIGSRLNYQLQIIDTPGFGDTRGLTRDQEIVGQIRQLFSDAEPKGVSCIDAVCFLIKAPDARLTAIQSYIFQSIMSLFGKDIKDNICSLITFADGNVPPVLAALKEAKLPFGEYFTFNNSALFATNVDIDSRSLSPMFWNIGLSSFRSFFIHLGQMQTKSLQLTKDVLLERYRLEAVVRALKENLEVGLQMIEVLKSDRRVLAEHKSKMEAHKNYEVEVTEPRQTKTLIPGRVHNTKCENCYVKCHPHCGYGDDEDKRFCCVMDGTGHCTVCPDHCEWRAHKNDAYTYIHTTVKVKKTLKELQEKYNDASGKALSHQQIVEKNELQLQELTDNIDDMMVLVKKCNERLQEIALKPNPLTMTEHIDLMIENEKMTKKQGYLQRINILNEFRKDAEVHKKVEVFTRVAATELGASTIKTLKTVRPTDSKSVLERVTHWLRNHIPGFSI